MKITETNLVNSILDGLNLSGKGSFNRINNNGIFVKTDKDGFYRKPNKYTPSGISDIIGCMCGKYIAIEVKTEKEFKRVTKFIDNLHKNNFIDKNLFINYSPKNKWEEHIIDQLNFIYEKQKNGGIGFFTCSLKHTLEVLK
jgi:hypothetical protein